MFLLAQTATFHWQLGRPEDEPIISRPLVPAIAVSWLAAVRETTITRMFRLLAALTRMNIATQAERRRELSDSREVESDIRVRAAMQVKALNEGKQKELGPGFPTGGTGADMV